MQPNTTFDACSKFRETTLHLPLFTHKQQEPASAWLPNMVWMKLRKKAGVVEGPEFPTSGESGRKVVRILLRLGAPQSINAPRSGKGSVRVPRDRSTGEENKNSWGKERAQSHYHVDDAAPYVVLLLLTACSCCSTCLTSGHAMPCAPCSRIENRLQRRDALNR